MIDFRRGCRSCVVKSVWTNVFEFFRDLKALPAILAPVWHTRFEKVLFFVAILGWATWSASIANARPNPTDSAANSIAGMLESAPHVKSQGQLFQIAIELPAGFEGVEVEIVARNELRSHNLVLVDETLPDGRRLARLSLEVFGAVSESVKGICIRLGSADRADGYFLIERTGGRTESSCLETGTSAWNEAAIWGEGTTAGILLRPKIGGGMLDN